MKKSKKKPNREASLKRKHGANCFKDWGAKGGNPLLKKYRINKEGNVVRKR